MLKYNISTSYEVKAMTECYNRLPSLHANEAPPPCSSTVFRCWYPYSVTLTQFVQDARC